MIDITDNRFGKLIAIERLGSNGEGHSIWKCICDCGNFKNIRLNSLKRGYTKSCGCLRNKDKSIKIGDKYGKWTIFRYAGKMKQNRPTFECICECGTMRYVVGDSLRTSKSKSCGCVHKTRFKRIPLSENHKKKIGNSNRGKRRSKECKEKMSKSHTKHGLSRSREYNRFYKDKYKEYKKLTRKNWKWTILHKKTLISIQPSCVVCGHTSDLQIDHLQPISKGYSLEPGNAIILCGKCNNWKSNKSLKEIELQSPNFYYQIMYASSIFFWEINDLDK